MAARKPKNVSAWLGGNRGTVQSGGGRPTGIVDDIAKGIKDIASPWLPAAPGQNRSVTQAQGLARATAETLDQTVTGGLVKAGTQGNKALAKQVAINAAALGTGYVAGKAIQTAVGAAGLTAAGVALNRSGVLARAKNVVTGKTIVVHGSPVAGLKTIEPNLSNAAKMQGYTTPEVYAANPARGKSWITASDYAQLSGSGVQGKGKGSVYIASAKTKDLVNSPNPANLKTVPVFASEKPLTVIKEYPVMQGSKKFNEDLKRLGVKLPKVPKKR
jgi:hypothetical protein